MSAAKATGSAWKLPPDSASSVSAKMSGLSETPLASMSERRGGLAQEIEASAHHLGLAAQAIGILHSFVAGEMRSANGAPGEQRAQGGGDFDLAGMAPERMDARVERRIRSARAVGRQRAGRQGGAEQRLGLEQADERVGGRELRAVEQREPLLGREA